MEHGSLIIISLTTLCVLYIIISNIIEARESKETETDIDNRIMEDLNPNHEITLNHSTNLNNNQEHVLDLYEKCNIKIPVEIIDDLSYNQLTDKKEIFDFIETQRQAWKYEHMKKPSFRRTQL